MRPPPFPSSVFVWGGVAILLVLNLVRIHRVLNSCRIWSPTELKTPQPLPATHCLYVMYFDTGKEGGVEPERSLEGR